MQCKSLKLPVGSTTKNNSMITENRRVLGMQDECSKQEDQEVQHNT